MERIEGGAVDDWEAVGMNFINKNNGLYRCGIIHLSLGQPPCPLRISKSSPFSGFPLVQMVSPEGRAGWKNVVFLEFIRPFTADLHLMLDCYRPIIGLLFPLFFKF